MLIFTNIKKSQNWYAKSYFNIKKKISKQTKILNLPQNNNAGKATKRTHFISKHALKNFLQVNFNNY